MQHMKWLLLLLWIWAFSEIGYARELFLRNIAVQSILHCGEIYSTHIDKQGNLWLSAENGLYRYDGTDYTHFTYTNIESLAGNNVQEDELGRIWYSTFDSKIYYVDHDSIFLMPLPYLNSQINDFHIAQNKLTYLSKHSYLITYDIVKKKILQQTKVNPQDRLFRLDNGYVHAAETQANFYNNDGRFLQQLKIKKNEILIRALFSPQLVYYISSQDNQLCVHQKDQLTNKIIYSISKIYPINGFEKFKQLIVIYTREGVIVINLINGKIHHLLQNQQITDVMQHPNGELWMSTEQNGIYVYDPTSEIETITLQDQTFSSKVVNHQLYLFNHKGLVSTLQNKELKNLIEIPNKLHIYDIASYKNAPFLHTKNTDDLHFLHTQTDQLVIATSGYKEIVFVDSVHFAAAQTGACVLVPVQLKKTIWSAIVQQYQSSFTNIYNGGISANIESNVRVRSVAFNPDQQEIYYATNIGLLQVTPTKKTFIPFHDKPLHCKKIIYANHRLFILLHAGELLVYNTLNHTFSSPFSLPQGIDQIKKTDAAIIYFNAHQARVIDMNTLQPITQPMYNSFSANGMQDVNYHDSLFYIITGNQLLTCATINQNHDTQFLFHVTGITSTQKKYSPNQVALFNENDNNISIHFSIPLFLRSKPSVSYRINEADWQQMPEYNQHIYLASLKPGKYLIDVKIDERIYLQAATFTILAPWYKHPLIPYVIIIISGLFAFYLIRQRSMRQQKENALLLEKAEIEKSLRQSMLSSIKSQMNPHFLFNALNTIQSYIVTEDKQNAAAYLSKFSKLTRKILEMSDKETVCLAEELDALHLYIELEKMRFEELNYTIEIANHIAVHQIHIPSMIIQPYVENAIKHGLLHKQGDKNLFIKIEEINQHIIITIEDNGVGRDKSLQLNQLKRSRHQSFATNANKKRIEILNIQDNQIGINIIDKFNEANEATGTIVIITIPIIV